MRGGGPPVSETPESGGPPPPPPPVFRVSRNTGRHPTLFLQRGRTRPPAALGLKPRQQGREPSSTTVHQLAKSIALTPLIGYFLKNGMIMVTMSSNFVTIS